MKRVRARALGFVVQGCEGGVALACFAEADLLYKGERVAADRERAVALLERMCALEPISVGISPPFFPGRCPLTPFPFPPKSGERGDFS
jgi:hypothetical protein